MTDLTAIFRQMIAPAVALALAAPVLSAPPPPPHPAVAKLYSDFFTAMPKAFPVEDLSTLEALISEQLVVTFDGETRFTSRDEWLQWLQSMAVENGVERTSMSREEFFYQNDDRIMVREFWHPYKKDVTYHPDFPHKLVSYQFKDLRLVRVDYVAELRPMGEKPGEADRG